MKGTAPYALFALGCLAATYGLHRSNGKMLAMVTSNQQGVTLATPQTSKAIVDPVPAEGDNDSDMSVEPADGTIDANSPDDAVEDVNAAAAPQPSSDPNSQANGKSPDRATRLQDSESRDGNVDQAS